MKVSLEKPAFRKMPTQQRAIEKVERILDCAAKILVDKKVRLSTRQIASEAGLSPGTIYQFFNNVDSIMAALVERLMAGLYEEMVEALKDYPKSNFATVSSNMINCIVQYYYDNKGIVSVVLAAQNHAEFTRVNEAFNTQISALMTKSIVLHNALIEIETVERLVDVLMMVSDSMSMKIWSLDDDAKRERYAEDLRFLIVQYVNKTLNDEGSVHAE